MAQRFDLTAQLQLQAPRNVQQVVNQVRRQLQGVNVNVNVQANARAVNQVNQSLQNTNRQANNAARSIGVLNKNLSEAARRFGIITLATGTMLSFAQSVKRAVKEAIEFERELVKISQVTGQSVQQLKSLTSEITRLSTSLGVSSTKLLETSRILAQAGFSAEETRKALDILAKTTLGSSFDDISDTVEGAIAVLRQFRSEALAAGGDIQFLEQTLDAINSVSKSFAVESSDLIAVIQRVGGVFASAGGSVNELIALFTSVRATTRESAETIATGLRTIFTRLQRTDTVNQLEQLGISLRDAQGRFVGAYEAVRRLAIGLSSLDPRDYRFSEIVEELGGFRQIGKVIPLIQQFAVAQDALNVAMDASGSVAEDALTAQQALAVQAQKVREEFAALIRKFADSSTFKSITGAALKLASAFIKIGEALEPVLPLLTSLLALKIGQGLAPGLGAILGFGGRRRYGGGVIRKFARGGFVPGVGNSDSVPAMLQPGEFVIRKSSAQKLGAETLLAMNQNKYANGVKVSKSGNVTKKDIAAASNSELEEVLNNKSLSVASRLGIESELGRRRNKPKIARLKDGIVGGLFLQQGEGGKRGISKDLKGIQLQSNFPRVDRIEGDIYTGLLDKRASGEIKSQLEPNIINAVQSAASNTIKAFEIPPLGIDESQAAKSAVQKVDTTAIEGYIFEAFISAISGAQLSEAGATFDYVNPSSSAKSRLKNIFGPDPVMGRLLDAKRTLNSDTVQSGKSSIANKIVAGINSGLLSREDFIVRNKGGGVGTDTVPALLTPGEFVINRSSAQKIGYGNLASMNKDGVARFASGGAVGVQRLATGGQIQGEASRITTFQGLQMLDKTAMLLSNALNARIAAEQKRIMQNNKNLTADQALNLSVLKINSQFKNLEKDQVKLVQTVRDLIKEGKKVQKAQSKYAKLLGAINPANVMRGLRDPNIRQQAIGRVDQVSNAMQQFVFLGSAVAALTAQFSSLTDVQKQATTETAAFVTSIVGIGGTLIGMFTSMLSSGALVASTNATQAASSITSAGADAIETGASVVSAGADVVETGASTASAVADTAEAGASGLAAVAVMVFVGAIFAAIAIIVVMAAMFKYAAATAKAQADELKEAADIQLKGIQELNGSVDEFIRLQKEMVEKQKLAAENNAAVWGSLRVGAVGAAAGSIFGPVGIVMGAAIGSWMGATSDAAEETRRQAQIARMFNGELELSARLLAESTEAQAKFKQALSDIDIEENLAPKERATRRLLAQREMVDDGRGGNIRLNAVNEANRQLEQLSKFVAKPISQLRESDFSKDPELLAIFQNAQNALASNLQALSLSVAESRKTLAEAAAIEITGDKSFDELMKEDRLFAQALNAAQEAIREEAQARINALQAQKNREKDPERKKDLQEKIDQAREREQKQLEDLEQGYKDVAKEAQENARKLREAAAAQEAYRQSLMKIKNFEKALASVEHALSKFEKSISNLGAIFSGGDLDFSRAAPQGIEDISQVFDRRAFEKGLDEIANGLGVGGRRLARRVKEISEFIARAEKELIGVQFEKGAAINTEKILGDLGLDINKLTQEQRSQIDEQLREALKDGMISEEEFNDIFQPLMKEGQRAADALNRANDARNRELKVYQDFTNILEEQFQREIEARQKFIDAQAKGQELMAQARGQELTPAQKEAARTASAQIPLNPFGLQAGDVAGVSDFRNQAQARLLEIQKSVDAGTASKETIAEYKMLSTAIKATTDELDRLSDQSEKAADIMAEIEKERAKRESLKGITQDFVVGGGERRREINRSFAGIQQAVATGTLQMQSEEQRRSTVEMLDRLADIEIPGAGGMTGSQVKEQLIMQDAMRLGMDPEVAQAIYGATSTEEQLIQAMDNLAAQQIQAAEQNAAFQVQNTATLVESEQRLIQSLDNLAASMRGALMSSGGQVPRYLSSGGISIGNMFKPKGTDTIPAMLTPGEYVLQKSAVDRIGVNAVDALNNGKAGVTYLRYGGSVDGPRTGSPAIGNGGMLSIDFSGMQRSFDNFLGNFSGIFDNIVKTFSGIQNSLTQLSQSMSGFTMQHNVTVEGLISIGGLNMESIKQELSTSIGQMVGQEVTRVFNENNKKFKAG